MIPGARTLRRSLGLRYDGMLFGGSVPLPGLVRRLHMRGMVIALFAVTFVITPGRPASAAVQTVKGQLIDQACYKMDKMNTGERHTMKSGPVEDCATECVKEGRPVALLTTDGKVYQITGVLAANKNEKLVGHMTHTVEVTGDVSTEQDGTMKIAATNLKMISK
jgi:hypothetical protein